MMKKKLVALTGAGISAESGLSTFRDSDGLWENYRIEDVATHEALLTNREEVVRFANMLRKQCVHCEPNAGHKLLADLEKEYDVTVITQNIDNLHEKAGSSNVIHLHGNLMKCCTMERPDVPLDLPNGELDMSPDATDEDGHLLRPFIVYFGEAVPMMDAAARVTQEADVFVVIGSSLNVYPAAGLMMYTKPGIPRYVIDPKPVAAAVGFEHIQATASEGMKKLTKRLRNE